ncbi:mitochondrial 54S ribosomal protein mrpl1 [Orbilia brochopaga]|uniref:Mitochondrial 54S ribosomal protein mrpl1 n=1 Tax=Orbilia brochopaga TaxID=3140254 RepID=A0AAV9URV0_9PEZI
MASSILAATSLCRSCLARAPRHPSSAILPAISPLLSQASAFSTTPAQLVISKKTRSPRATKKKKPKTHWKIWNHADVPKWALMDAIRYIRAFEVGKDQNQMKYDLAVKLQTTKNGPTVKSRTKLPKAVRTDLKICVFAEGKQAEVARQMGAAVVGTTELWEEIRNGKIDFDRVLCHNSVYPDFQKANLGRILGPKGLMPSPKTATVVGNVAEAITAMIGASEYRERSGVVRIAIGKLAFTPEELRDNIKTFMNSLSKDLGRIEEDKRINEVVLSSTNSPGFSLSGEFRSDIGQDGDAVINPNFELAGIDAVRAEEQGHEEQQAEEETAAHEGLALA